MPSSRALAAGGGRLLHGQKLPALRPGFPYMSLKTEETTPCDKYLEKEFGEPTVKFTAYDSFYNYYFYPEITMEHATFADAVSNGPEGNPNYKG